MSIPVLDPWSDDIRFLWAPDDGRTAYVVPRVKGIGLCFMGASVDVETRTTTLGIYESTALNWRGVVFRAVKDEHRLLVALCAAEAWILFVDRLRWEAAVSAVDEMIPGFREML